MTFGKENHKNTGMKEEKTTGTLNAVLKEAKPRNIQEYLSENADYLVFGVRPFATYFREILKKKKIKQQDVFLGADISEGYGYKLISEEKHTVQRDVILRLCLASRMDLRETDRALKLYGMSPLYARNPRDAVLIIAINTEVYEIEKVNDLLKVHGMETLYEVTPA